jgi:hypothetical protein
MATVFFSTLSCLEQNDFTGADSVSLPYNANRMWGPEDMTKGQAKSVGTRMGFFGTATVSLWEHDDLDPDDHLGDITIRESEKDHGQRSQKFAKEAEYTLFYFVTQ